MSRLTGTPTVTTTEKCWFSKANLESQPMHVLTAARVRGRIKGATMGPREENCQRSVHGPFQPGS